MIMKVESEFEFGNLNHWLRLDLGIAPEADFSISEERSRGIAGAD